MTKAPKFLPRQPVTLHFTGTQDEPFTYDAVIIENCDDQCRPLTDYWSVQIMIDGKPGRTFAFSGAAISAREVA